MKLTKIIIILLFISSSFAISQAYRDMFTGTIILNEDNDNNSNLYVIKAPVLTQSVTFTIPVGEGQNGDILTTNGINSTTWSELTFGAVGGSSDGLIQFNEDGFNASSSFIWDYNNKYLGIGLESPSYSLHTSGTITVGSVANSAVLALASANSPSNYLYIKTNPSSNSSVNYTLPEDNGTSNQGLVTSSSGSLYWGGELRKGPLSNNDPDNNDIDNSDNAYMGGGNNNDIDDADNSTLWGGYDNDLEDATSAIIIGGYDQDISDDSDYSVIMGGNDNDIKDDDDSDGYTLSGAIVGGNDNDFNQKSHYSIIMGGEDNETDEDSYSSVILGGYYLELEDDSFYSIIAGGGNSENGGDSDDRNKIKGRYNGILAGVRNDTENNSTRWSVVFGGYDNDIEDDYGFIGGGYQNQIDDEYGAVLGGYQNKISDNSIYSAILFGKGNDIEDDSQYNFVGGLDVRVYDDAEDCVMFGRRAINDDRVGNIMFADGNNSDLTTGGNNRFYARFSNGYRLWTNAASTVGVKMDSDDNAWSSVSDRNLKTAINDLNPLEFFNKIKKLEIFSWSYKGYEKEGIRNYGPMSQDFNSLFGKDNFGIYGNDKSIKELDAAAIFVLGVQGTNTKIEVQGAEIKKVIATDKEISKELNEIKDLLEKIDNKLEK